MEAVVGCECQALSVEESSVLSAEIVRNKGRDGVLNVGYRRG